jgi:4-hydroxy-2-oxoheptanedioate aldolase
MSPSRKPDFRSLLNSCQPAYMAWLSLGSPLIVEIVAATGWQAVLIDQQHGVSGQSELIDSLTAARAANVPAMVRVASLDMGLIGQALDAGAQGVMAPMIETPEEAAALVQATKYPSMGRRSFGPYRAKHLTDGDYFTAANSWTIACGQIETERAVRDIDEICSVPGLDMICVGPNDLAIAMSSGRSRDIRAPAVLEAIEYVRARASAKGIVTTIFANDRDYATHVASRGWNLISIGTDAAWISNIAKDLLPPNVRS